MLLGKIEFNIGIHKQSRLPLSVFCKLKCYSASLFGGGAKLEEWRSDGENGEEEREGKKREKSEEEKEIWKKQSCKLHPNSIHTNPKQVLQKVCKVFNNGK